VLPLPLPDDARRDDAQRQIRDPARHRGDPVEAAVGFLAPVTGRRARQAPRTVAREAGSEEDEQHRTERLACDHLERALLIGRAPT
jgi:hypothetical protein